MLLCVVKCRFAECRKTGMGHEIPGKLLLGDCISRMVKGSGAADESF